MGILHGTKICLHNVYCFIIEKHRPGEAASKSLKHEYRIIYCFKIYFSAASLL
ncbi:hypothetical protein GY50_0611 [Dehalococcoides mccartyi GY50]|nr:hypothetical protein GY50_0611 [Dehalococcoides mccartyi GY50]